MREQLVDLIINRPGRVLLSFGLFCLLLFPGLALLKADFSYRAWYSEQDPLLINFDKFEQTFGNDDNIVIGITHKDSLYHKQAIELIFDLTEQLWRIPNIVRVDSLTNHDHISSHKDMIEVAPLISQENRNKLTPEIISQLKSRVLNNKLLENFLISKDEKMTVLRARVVPSLKQRLNNEQTIRAAEKLVAEFEQKYPQFKFYLAGTATFIHIFTEISERDLSVLIPLLCTIFGCILFYIYRTKSGVLLPYFIIFISMGLMLGLSGYLGHSITTISSAAPSILLTIAVADTVHILTVYFFGRRQGLNNVQAVKYSLIKNFLPTFLTSITTAIGFFSFSNSLILSISNLGIDVGFGVLFAWAATYFVLGPILVLYPMRIPGLNSEGVTELDFNQKENNFIISKTTKNFVQFLYKAKYPILIFSVILIVLSFFQAKNLEINLDPNKQFKEDHPYKIAFNHMQNHFGPMSLVQIMINAGDNEAAKNPSFLNRLDQFESWLNQQSYITKTFSILDTIKSVNQALHQGALTYHSIPLTQQAVAQNLFFYSLGVPQGRDINHQISLNADYIRLIANWNIEKSKEAISTMDIIEQQAKKMGIDALITGKMPLFHQLTPYIVQSFIHSFTIALISITIILIIVLKSLKLGLLALVPNLFPLIIGSGIYALSGEYIDIASVLIIAVCLGIAVDDSIHFLFEYQKFRKLGFNQPKTFENIFTNTVPSLINTTIIIAMGFGSFFVADYIPNAKFGMMVSLILIIALIADIFVLPAVLMLVDKDKQSSQA